jgi:hypothetical protein
LTKGEYDSSSCRWYAYQAVRLREIHRFSAASFILNSDSLLQHFRIPKECYLVAIEALRVDLDP